MRFAMLLLFLIIPATVFSASFPKVYLSNLTDLDSVVVPENKRLYLYEEEILKPQNSFKNLGQIQSYGYIDLSDLQPDKISSNGFIIIGSTANPVKPHLKLDNTNQLRKLMVKGLSIGDETSPTIVEINDFNIGFHEFYASREPNDFPENRLTLQNGVYIKAGNFTATGTGSQLGLGWQSFYNLFAEDKKADIEILKQGLPSESLSTIRSETINLFSDCPPSTPLTLSSGNIMVAGDNPKLTIGRNGEKTLQLTQSLLTLGDGSGKGANNGYVKGNITIGTNAYQSHPSAGMVVASGNWLVDGNIYLTKDGYFYFNHDPNKKASLAVNKNFEITGCEIGLRMADLTVKGTLNATDNTKIDVLDSSHLIANNIKMNGGQLNFDPDFIAAGNTTNASMGALSFENGNIDAKINVGRNSMVSLGTNDPEWLRTQINNYQTAKSSLWGRDITAALAIASPQKITTEGGIRVDGNWTTRAATTAEANKAYFGGKSLLVIDAARLGAGTALSGGGTAALEVAPDAKLLIADAAAGSTVKVAENFAAANVSAGSWNYETTSPLTAPINVVIQNNSSSSPSTPPATHPSTPDPGLPSTPPVTPPSTPDPSSPSTPPATPPATPAPSLPSAPPSTPTAPITPMPVVPAPPIEVEVGVGMKAKDAFPALSNSVANVLDQLAVTNIDTQSNNDGVKFLSRAIDTRYLANDKKLVARTVESTARMTAASGAVQMIKLADDSVYRIISQKQRDDNPFSLWIAPLYANLYQHGMNAGNLSYSYNGGIGGIVLGGDYGNENLRFGINLNIGGGYGKSGGDFLKTENNMDFWGIGGYGNWSYDNFSLNANISFMSSYNKIKQDLPDAMLMRDLKSDIQTRLVSTGIEGKYNFTIDFMNIEPHAGVKFTNISTNSYNIGNIGSNAPENMNIWEFPAGIKFSKNIEIDDYKIEHFIDLIAVQRTNDTHLKDRVKFAGKYNAETATQIFDSAVYGGSAGINVKKDNLTFSVQYQGMFGQHSANNMISGNLIWEF